MRGSSQRSAQAGTALLRAGTDIVDLISNQEAAAVNNLMACNA